MLHFFQTGFSSRSLAWSVMVEEQSLLFRVNFPCELLATLLVLTVTLKCAAASHKVNSLHSLQLCSYSDTTLPVSLNNLSCSVTFVHLTDCGVKASSVGVSPDNESPLVGSTLFLHFLRFWGSHERFGACKGPVRGKMTNTSCHILSFPLHLPLSTLLPSSSYFCSHPVLFCIHHPMMHHWWVHTASSKYLLFTGIIDCLNILC